MMAEKLSADQCVLLAVHYASEGNVAALHSFAPFRADVLSPELILRILLTYLPEAVEPREYTAYVGEVASQLEPNTDRKNGEIDVSPVVDLDGRHARRRVKRLNLLDISPPQFLPYAPEDLLTRFICHRAYRIDSEAGLLNLIPPLVEPFLDRNTFIRTWYISEILPILRLELEYYPQDETPSISLTDFYALDSKPAVDLLLAHATAQLEMAEHSNASAKKIEVTRDIRSLVGPWMYGDTNRKRRKLDPSDDTKEGEQPSAGISASVTDSSHQTGQDWEYVLMWMVSHARGNFQHITRLIEEWSGPSDVDLGSFNTDDSLLHLQDEAKAKLNLQYAQAAFSSCYAVKSDTQEVIQGAHHILGRVAELLDFIPPPDLATSVDSLPRIQQHVSQLDGLDTVADLEPDALLRPDHPLTLPKLETYMLLQMLVYSAYQFSSLGYPVSPVGMAKMQFYTTPDELLELFRRILKGLCSSGARVDDAQWRANRAKFLWLWNWGVDAETETNAGGAGPLGKIPRNAFEEEILKSLIDTSCYGVAIELYLKSSPSLLEQDRIADIILAKVMESYDGASNGNRTRGGMKKANDIILAFRPFFKENVRFQQASALISATHALSFYSLTLQHGVPFQPVIIRVNSDPIGLLTKVLEQNPRSYTKLDDLVGIGQNFVSAGLPEQTEDITTTPRQSIDHQASLEKLRKDAERRVSFMAIEAALREDDFETAYSYIVNRLTPSGTDITAPRDSNSRHKRNISTSSMRSQHTDQDDISWRAAFLAGRYRPSTSSPPSLRRLEQRTELLSLSLLLAPVSALTEILAAWRRCEEETSALQLSQQQADEDFDDRADKRLSSSALPGNFTVSEDGGQPAMLLNQKRREMGRLSGRVGRGDGGTPVSMFDLTRSAARAFSDSAWIGSGRNSGIAAESQDGSLASLTGETDAQQRVRKRDMVANAASGALASGLGWVLGATPASQKPSEPE